ncbi:uncharacterized protein LOC127252641 [Andrographis paniculata]|uniref:uncharacterized protein LOC127252641 n=1 Tax=Andrographis paniculata TaxID=175694 RepID=UPI0021E818AB|nr:uncharacterized protein LOC127252641 [Andrographis paniculata]
MSRREDRSSDAKRHRSRFDREPSPKRSRRDGKAEFERVLAVPETDRTQLDRGLKSSRRPRDPLPLEVPSRRDSKFESEMRTKESENRTDRQHGVVKQSSDSARIPQSRSYFEHDDRGTVGKVGRNFNRRTDRERGWWRDPREGVDKMASNEKDDKPKDNGRADDRVWRHDGYFQMQANPNAPLRRRPAFREQKIPADEKAQKAEAGMPNANPPELGVESSRRDERGYVSRHSERQRDLNMGRSRSFSSRDRSDPGNRYRGSSGSGYHNHRAPVGRVEKWKHDLYDEANKSPSPKKDEDQISKIEALLAS